MILKFRTEIKTRNMYLEGMGIEMTLKPMKVSNSRQEERVEIKEHQANGSTPENTDIYGVDRRKFHKEVYKVESLGKHGQNPVRMMTWKEYRVSRKSTSNAGEKPSKTCVHQI